MADANPGRGLPANKIVEALQALSGEMQAMRGDVAGIESEVAGLRGIVPRTGAAPRGAVRVTGQEGDAEAAVKASRDALSNELKRLETLKAETAEMERQQALLREGLIIAQGYRPGGGRGQEAANFGQIQRDRILGQVTGRNVPGGPLVVPGQVALGPRQQIIVPNVPRTYDRPLGEHLAQEERLTSLARERAADEAAAAQSLQRQVAALAEQQRMEANLAVLAAQRAERQRVAGIVAGMAPGERQAAMEDLTYQGGLKRYPGLPVHYVNQGPDFRQAANEAEFGAYRGGRTATRDIEGMTSRINRLGIVQAEASQQMRRHGALTTEFLTALARGETTLQEFGYQIGATTAKFAGWTAAAAAVYGVLDAVKQLGTGAVESANGVSTLSRFFEGDHPLNKAAALQGFRDVSAATNVPIGDVATAQASFARVFKDQDESLTAARVSIQAYKLDQISAADSQRYFTAIVQEFGLSAKDLPIVFDQISAAQRRMGARVAETLPAIARSAAAVRNTGGDINQLIALAATAQVASGQTGNVVGTAFSRAASNFYRQPANQRTIRDLGINPNQGFTQLLIEAVRRSQDLSGIQRTELARAIGGPQYGGRIFQTLLGQQDRLTRTLQVTSPNAARGSAAEEMNKQLHRVDEQIHAVGNNLQRMGSALAQSGALLPLGVALRTLNLMLSTTNSLIEAFDHLPGPVRALLVGLVEVRTVMAVMRRTQFGAGIADVTGLGFLGPGQAERGRRTAIIGARQAEQSAANRFESTINRSQEAAIAARANRTAAEALRLQADTERNGVRRVALQQQAVAAEGRYKTLAAESAALEQEALGYQATMTAAQERRVALQKREISAQEALVAENALLVPRNGPQAAEERTASGLIVPAGAAREAERATEEIAGRGAQIRAAGGQVLNLGKRAAAGIGNFVSGLGLIGQAFIAFTIGQTVEDAIRRATAGIEKANHDLDRVPHSLEELKRVRDEAAHKAEHGPQHGLGTRIAEAFVTTGDYLRNFPNMTPSGASQADIQTQADRARRDADTALIHARQRTIGSRLQNVGLANNEIIGYAQRDVDNIKAWGQTRGQFNANFERYLRDVGVSIETIKTGQVDQGTLDRINQIRAAGLKQFGPTAKDPFADFRHGGLQQALDFTQFLSDRSSLFGSDPNDLQTAMRGLTYEVSKHGHSTDPKVIGQLSQLAGRVDDAIKQRVDDMTQELQAIQDRDAQRRVPTGTAAGAALVGFSRNITARSANELTRTISGLRRQRDHVYDNMDRVSSGYTKAQADLARLENLRDHGTFGERMQSMLRYGTPLDNRSLDRAIAQQKRVLAEQKQRVADTGKTLSRQAAKIQAQIDALESQRFDLQQQAIQTRVSYQQSTASDKSDQISIALRGDADLVKNAMAYHGPDRWKKILDALTQQNNDIAEQAQQHLTDIQSEGDLRTSRIMTLGKGGDQARLRSQLDTARRVLAAARAEAPNPGRKDAIRAAEKQVNDITFQILQGAQQDAADTHDLARQLYDSRMAIRMAGLTDPLAIDRLQLQQDRGDLARIHRGDFKTQIEYQIARNNQRAKTRQDEVKLRGDTIQGDYEDAQYLHNIGRMTDDAYIGQLRQILHMKGISKQMRRQLNEEIYRMTHADAAGGLDLNVGNIRLPSIYEVRRAMRGAAGTQTVVHNSATVHVAVSRDVDLGKLGGALEDTFGGPVMANLRAAGVA